MQRLILRTRFSPGDIVLMTAAVRDLHRCYPRKFATDVRTACPELWEHNPYVTPLREEDRGVKVVDCSYPLINRCNQLPYHCIHGYIEFLNDALGLRIRPTAFKGDIHLSAREKSWCSQVRELTRDDTPFWIVAAGGKYDISIKWWETRRYQEVIDHFRGKIQFVQVGESGHHHPWLEGVIDLRGRTSLRELVRLVYHAQGVLCSVTCLMHLAAAVEVKAGQPAHRPCVVIAGGREPAHWEAYPDHQFIHTNGALPCCGNQGCWKDRIFPLGDGDKRDRPDRLCVDVVNGLPRCLDLITAAEVIRRMETYFKGGAVRYLSSSQVKAARRGVRATKSNSYDEEPLNLHNAHLALKDFIQRIPNDPGGYRGRGIVICGGGVSYFTNAWVGINMLRRLGCRLPIQLWHWGKEEVDARMKSLVAPFNVECVDALAMRPSPPARILGGWELKPFAVLHSPFREVLLLDADNVPVRNPEFLFDTPQFRKTGAIFWPDYGRSEKTQVIWHSCGLVRPKGPEFESGQIVVDKRKCWHALVLCMWFNENSDFFYRYLHGDKESFHLAFRKLNKDFSMVRQPIKPLVGTMCQHDFQGRRLFQHRNTDKWNLFLRNQVVPDFWFENECRQDILRLRQLWDGRMGRYGKKAKAESSPRNRRCRPPLKIQACMISCAQRTGLRRTTLQNLAATDWGEELAFVQIDSRQYEDPRESQQHTAFLALKEGLNLGADYLLFLEDDLGFNRHLRRNLLAWQPLQERRVTLAGLYNPGLRALACDVPHNAIVVDPDSIFGSQAFLVSRSTIKYLLRHWNEVEGMQDIKMSRLAARLQKPLFYHAPSLVQHMGKKSVWGGRFHRAVDFEPHWQTEARSAMD